MARALVLFAIAALANESLAVAAAPTGAAPAPDPARICKMVVSAERGAKPYELCMSKAEWDAKKIADAKDATRMVCRYQEDIKTRFRSFKVCMTAAEWENNRLAERQAIERIQNGTCVPGGGC